MKALIEKVFQEYKKKESEIEKGIITMENVEFVIKSFDMDHMSNEEICKLWCAIDDYFEDLAAIRDGSGEIIGWKPGMSFVFDTDSAFKEVCNYVRRERRAGRRSYITR